MEVMNCKECRKLFNYLGSGPRICPECKQKLEDKFQEAKKYIRENKVVSIAQVSEAVDVSANQIKQWIREERLVFQEGSGVGLECENCGASILTGRFCVACKNSMSNQLGDAFGLNKKPEAPKKKERVKDKMFFLDK